MNEPEDREAELRQRMVKLAIEEVDLEFRLTRVRANLSVVANEYVALVDSEKAPDTGKQS